MNEIQELLKWVDNKRKPRWRPHLSQAQNEFVRKIGIQHAREVEAILLKHRAPKTIQNYRNSDPNTSKDAARKMKVGAMKHELLMVFDAAGPDGLTAYEAAQECGYLDRDTVPGYWKRVSDLAASRFIVSTDAVRKNPETGMDNQIYVVTEEGHRALTAAVMQ